MTQKTLIPLPQDLPDFQSALADLGRVPDILYRGLEYAAYKTSSYRDAEFPKKWLDACLSAAIFRAHAIEFLKQEGLDAGPDGPRWWFNRLPFLGISFYYNRLHIRILKGPGGALPGCGISGRRKKFYNQLPSNYLIGNAPMRSKANLIVLWDFDSAYALAQLWLALPANGGRRPQDVSVFWCDPLVHPAEKAAPPPPPTTQDDGMDELVRPRTEAAKDEDMGQSGAR
jgi:hypothetical protein